MEHTHTHTHTLTHTHTQAQTLKHTHTHTVTHTQTHMHEHAHTHTHTIILYFGGYIIYTLTNLLYLAHCMKLYQHRIIYTCTHTHTLAAPSSTVQITDSGSPPSPGQAYSLTCELTGVNGSLTSSAYQWKRGGNLVATEQSLSFSPLRLSDAGRYTCQFSLFGTVFSGAKDIRISGY